MGQAMKRTFVLLVEDEMLIRELVAEVLLDHGFRVHAVMTASDALEFLEDHADVDVLFTDINLAGTMDGAELARKARAMRPELPVVYASGRHTAKTIAPLVPRSLFLNKPYNLSDVCTLLDRISAH